MEWTNNKPKSPGWYWCKRDNDKAFIVEIVQGMTPVGDYKWAGPLIPPEENDVVMARG